jgi:hypothetical protein
MLPTGAIVKYNKYMYAKNLSSGLKGLVMLFLKKE